MKVKKVCFAASSGGHFEQLMMLKPLMDKYDSFVVTEKTKYQAGSREKTYFLPQINRQETGFVPKLLWIMVKSFMIFLKERPDVVVCTGVLAMLPLCVLCKLFKKKLVYIESFAKVNTPTQSGRFLYKYADRFYIQWESMKEVFPNAIYLGGIY